MEITICGHRRAAELLAENPNQLDIIFISSPDEKFYIENSHKIPGLAREMCELLFHDVATLRLGSEPPKVEHIQKALAFAKGRDKLIVSCQMGISRSSATAYLIKSMEVGPVEALNILDFKVHYPNSLVIAHGSYLLDKPEMIELISTWKIKADEVSDGPTL